MAKTFEKTRKQIAKKRNGSIEALHQNSRNSKRLHRAIVRDDRLDKLADARRKRDKPLIKRVKFFLAAVRENDGKALEHAALQSKINEFVHQHDEEYNEIRKTRRAGRPASAREDLLKMAIVELQKEYQEHGFYMPDLGDQKNVEMLQRWEDNNWAFLSNLSWVKISTAGIVKPSSFPPQGL